jgi:PPOX class probable F420-dependent enzyme
MSPDELTSFLSALPARTAKLATVRADGRPHLVPIWFDLDGDDIVFMTGADSVKGRNLARDPRAAVCVDDERPPFAFVTIEGRVELSEDPDELLAWGTRIGGRYMGAERAEDFGRRNAVPGELLVRLRPERTVSAADMSD